MAVIEQLQSKQSAGQLVINHYSEIGYCYDNLYGGFSSAVISVISRQLQFSSTETVLDIGGGTGEIGHLLSKKYSLQAPVICVDPVESMLEIAKKKEGIETVLATAEKFFSSKESKGKTFSRILVIRCYHHFKDPALVFEGVARMLTQDGVCLLLCTTPDSAPLLFQKARQLFQFVDYPKIVKLVESQGLRARWISDHEKRMLAKEDCFSFLRNRGYSSLSSFTDDEIEDGIKELDEQYKDNTIEAVYTFNIVIITKY